MAAGYPSARQDAYLSVVLAVRRTDADWYAAPLQAGRRAHHQARYFFGGRASVSGRIVVEVAASGLDVGDVMHVGGRARRVTSVTHVAEAVEISLHTGCRIVSTTLGSGEGETFVVDRPGSRTHQPGQADMPDVAVR